MPRSACTGKGSPRFFFLLFYGILPKGGGGLGGSKSFESLFFALKQSKANKCQCAKRLKTVNMLFLKFFVKEFWKKVTRKFQKGGQTILEKYHKKAIIFCWMASLSERPNPLETTKSPRPRSNMVEKSYFHWPLRSRLAS